MKARHFAAVIPLCGLVVGANAQARRPMVVDDLFSLQTLSDVRLSPDGTTIAAVIQRAWSDPQTYRPYPMFGNDQADMWILPTAGGPPHNITHGTRNGSGYWNPVWSPDGERLAMLSTDGGDNVRAYVWEKRSGRLKRVADRGVDTRARSNADGGENPLQWVDRNRLLVIALPEGEQPLYFRLRRQTRRIASEAWRKLEEGREPTSSVLEGGIVAGPEPSGQVLLVDVATMRAQVLAEGHIKYVMVSPDRQNVAVVTQARRPPPPPGKLLGGMYSGPSRLGFVSLKEGTTVRWADAAFNPEVAFGSYVHRWSPRGTALAILGTERPETDSPKAVFIVSAGDLSVRRTAEGLTPSALAWSDAEQLLVRGVAEPSKRADWWSFAPSSSERRNLTSGLTAPPSQLVRTLGANQMIGAADGMLWRIDAVTGTRVPLIQTGQSSVEAITWPPAEERATSRLATVIVRVRERENRSLLRVDFSDSTAKMSPLPQPPKATTLAAYDAELKFAVFTAPQDLDGTFLWTGLGGSGNFVRRLALNEQLAGIAGGEQQLIEYRSADGQPLKGILFLPAGYQKGKRYPLVTWVYPGTMIQSLASASDWAVKNHAHPDNLHILAGHGYAVLIPSMPGGSDLATRALNKLTTGVLPAIDRVVEMGVVDADRVAVMGQSGGGFVTYGLITQTTRFRAAIAISGAANQLTSYGVFSGETRYVNDIDEILTGNPAGRFDTPPWVDPGPYVKNSPVVYLDRVTTPLLILHGDIDYIPIQHAEEVFTGLARLGKRVRFVRYWGESHGAGDSPANIRDRWQQIFRWFDSYLRDAR